MSEVTMKPTNPKDALGIRKAPFSTVPAPVIAQIGLGMLEGSCKYGRHNYREMGVRGSVYYDAALRHLTAWWEGEDIDPDSGLSHVTKALASLTVLLDSMIMGNWQDDRPPRPPQAWMGQCNMLAQAILAKYPNPVAPYVNKPTGPLHSQSTPALQRLSRRTSHLVVNGE